MIPKLCVQLVLVVCLYRLFFRLGKIPLNDSSAMRTLDELLAFRAIPVEFKSFLTMWA